MKNLLLSIPKTNIWTVSRILDSNRKEKSVCPICKSGNTRFDYDFPGSLSCCDDCGCDFTTKYGAIILDPRNL